MVYGYKVFNPDWTCRGYQYAVWETFVEDGEISLCDRGFHFCKRAMDCFNYYEFNPKNKVARVVALGDVLEEEDKCCTNKIKILHELSWREVLDNVNIGKHCKGKCNTGNFNNGNRNTGANNSGDCNTGNNNSGCWNTGDNNSSRCNTGDNNSGGWNTGDNNSGGWNTGNGNIGNQNTGDWNKSNHSTGCFNTVSNPLFFFDKITSITFDEWRGSEAFEVLCRVLDKDSCKESITKREKKIIKTIPNFDPDKFYEITGIRID